MLPDVSRAMTEKMLTYALGRGLERYDRPTVRDITKQLAASGYGFQTLVLEVVRSLPFQSRRGEGAPAGRWSTAQSVKATMGPGSRVLWSRKVRPRFVASGVPERLPA